MFFIPNIGSLAATLFPTFYCLLQFGGYEEALIVLVLVGSIQGLVGNFIEPKIMGNSMNISALVTILSLTLWGAIWGITGMILSVPITMIMILVFSQFDSTRGIAILLSEKVKVEENQFKVEELTQRVEQVFKLKADEKNIKLNPNRLYSFICP